MGEEDGGDGFVGFWGMVLGGVEGGAGDEDGHEARCGILGAVLGAGIGLVCFYWGMQEGVRGVEGEVGVDGWVAEVVDARCGWLCWLYLVVLGGVKGLLWCCVKKCTVSSGVGGWFHAAVKGGDFLE